MDLSFGAWVLVIIAAVLVTTAVYDLLQRRHSILRNFPVIGHLRFLLEAVGPELRQYIVTDNDQERPFSRDQRRWVYLSAKRGDSKVAFGTDNALELAPDYLIVKHAAFPLPRPEPADDSLPCAKVLGGARGRRHAFRPASVVNVSAMSFGSLSAPATEAIDRGCARAGCLHNTGEGGLSPHHRHGADLVFQIGTGYFGCREPDGRFSLPRLVDVVAANPVRAIEIKLSQGAKPGLGGMLPAAKVSPEIAACRGVTTGVDCLSPSAHTAFRDVSGLLDFVETVAGATGLPVGIKSAVGDMSFWHELCDLMTTTGRGVDFVTVDGGEGGTGSAPLTFADHVALPFVVAMSRVYAVFRQRGLQDEVVFAGSGKLGFPETAALAFALGCDMVNVAREAMLAIGCIQAQRCQSGRCPAGVATQSPWLTRGLDVSDKYVRLANYVSALRHELLELSHACGVEHPALLTLDRFEILSGGVSAQPAAVVFGYGPGWGVPAESHVAALLSEMRGPGWEAA